MRSSDLTPGWITSLAPWAIRIQGHEIEAVSFIGRPDACLEGVLNYEKP